jgi:sugar phosphate isomerase/epimerase
MFIEGSTSLPRDAQDVERFDAHLKTAADAGAKVVRVAIGGRRYEQFEKLKQFQDFAERSGKSLQLAAPAAARHRIQLAIENHKDFRAPEMLGMLEHLDSEHVGICLDTGNSIALLEDPVQIIHTWTPWARSAHLKDLALCEYSDGFLLADVVLGEGLLDLVAIVASLRKAHPTICFSLEMATRDPLRVPCLTERYWATMPDVSGEELARTLRYVRANTREREALPHVSHLPIPEQIALEQRNIKRCLRYAAEHLDL